MKSIAGLWLAGFITIRQGGVIPRLGQQHRPSGGALPRHLHAAINWYGRGYEIGNRPFHSWLDAAIDGRWRVLVLWALHDKPRLLRGQRTLPGISEKDWPNS